MGNECYLKCWRSWDVVAKGPRRPDETGNGQNTAIGSTRHPILFSSSQVHVLCDELSSKCVLEHVTMFFSLAR